MISVKFVFCVCQRIVETKFKMFSFLPGQSSGTKGNAPKKDSSVAAGFDFAIPDLNNVNEEDLLNDPDLMVCAFSVKVGIF